MDDRARAINKSLILTVEFTDRCNFRCRMCDQAAGPPHGKQEGFLGRETFAAILESLADFPVELITPYWVGESLLHPEFAEMISELFAANQQNRLFRHLNLNTNAALLDADSSRLLLDSALGDYAGDTFVRIHFSLDAIHPGTYRRIKGGGDLARTEENVSYFLRSYAERGLDFPKFNLACIVMPENQLEIAEFARVWQQRCNELQLPVRVTHDWPEGCDNGIYLRRLDTKSGQADAEALHQRIVTEMGLVQAVPAGERIIRTNAVLKEAGRDHNCGRRPCSGPFKTPIVHWSGLVTVCCFDVGLQLVIGDIKRQSLREIWQGDAAHRLRMAHIRGDFRDFPPCQGCTNLNTPLLPDEEIKAWLVSSGEREDLWPRI